VAVVVECVEDVVVAAAVEVAAVVVVAKLHKTSDSFFALV
jgi:hypothetical protein